VWSFPPAKRYWYSLFEMIEAHIWQPMRLQLQDNARSTLESTPYAARPTACTTPLWPASHRYPCGFKDRLLDTSIMFRRAFYWHQYTLDRIHFITSGYAPRYLTARIVLAIDSPSSYVTGCRFRRERRSLTAESSLRSHLRAMYQPASPSRKMNRITLPISIILTPGQFSANSSTHYLSQLLRSRRGGQRTLVDAFSSDTGESTEKQSKTTCVSAYDNERSRSNSS
jgi:hypothetical protein